MNSLTFLHTADLHLDSPFQGLQSRIPMELYKRIQDSTFTSFTKVIDLAIRENVDFILISGDLFDSADRSVRAQVRFRKEMKRLDEQGISAYVIHGNHDHIGGDWTAIQWPLNVHVFTNQEVEIQTFQKSGKPLANLYGFSYQEKAVTKNMVPLYEKEGDAAYHIGLLHGSAEGSLLEHNNYAPFTIKQLLDKKFDYWALGHIHKRQVLHEEPLIVYPGNIQGRHRKETGEKGCYIVKLTENNSKISFHQTADILWENVQVSIADISSYSHLLDYCFQTIEGFRRYDQGGVLLEVELIGSGALHKDLHDRNLVDDLLSILIEAEQDKNNFVLVTTIRVHTTMMIERDKLKEESHFFGDLITCIDEYDGFIDALGPLFNHPQARKYLNSLSMEEKRDIVKEAEAIILNEMLND
ncbi:DNA repair exonuclease [Cytobacillus sp. S13-E01]|uniref:metallophosphoesterase family protein n=1 Tax=Cytobacillus sp. S13-E01 TaxID=3031326 RepID=UPI0023D861E2|nr:DNA repair exonuclease [Cytobacillus sp. S13-E01]MDF0726898.1 DNA repair exonuclease [Cytobacillus sp. S13-E01]